MSVSDHVPIRNQSTYGRCHLTTADAISPYLWSLPFNRSLTFNHGRCHLTYACTQMSVSDHVPIRNQSTYGRCHLTCGRCRLTGRCHLMWSLPLSGRCHLTTLTARGGGEK